MGTPVEVSCWCPTGFKRYFRFHASPLYSLNMPGRGALPKPFLRRAGPAALLMRQEPHRMGFGH